MSPKKRILRGVLAITLATPTIAQAQAVGSLPILRRPSRIPHIQPRPPHLPGGPLKPDELLGPRIRPFPQDPHGLHDPRPVEPAVSRHRIHVINAISKSLNTPHSKWRIQFKLLYSNIPKLIFADSGPLEFGNGFLKGSKDPNKYFKTAKGKNNQIVKEWTKTSKEPKVFIIGSGEDTEKIMDLIADLNKQRIKAFFYKACEPLCDDAIVGAFFITSDYVYIYDSRQGRNSGYIKVESKITSAILYDRLPLIINTEDFKKASKDGGSHLAVALVACYSIKCQTDICHPNGTPLPCCAIPFPNCSKS